MLLEDEFAGEFPDRNRRFIQSGKLDG